MRMTSVCQEWSFKELNWKDTWKKLKNELRKAREETRITIPNRSKAWCAGTRMKTLSCG
jgi:hypothetical protein